jgi:hypothetical protein
MVASLAIAVYAELGFRRLEIANRQMAVALEMEATLPRRSVSSSTAKRASEATC